MSGSFTKGAPAAVAALTLLGGSLALGPPAFAAADLAGVWMVTGYQPTAIPARQRIPRTVEGEAPPLQPWAAKLYEERIAASDAGRPFAGTTARCLPSGMPLMMMGATYPILVVQSPSVISLLFEENHSYRTVYIDGRHPDDLDPGFMGHSTGRWDGDTLVVDTVGLNTDTTIDFTGLPHTEKLHIVERIRRLDPETLEDVLTLDDPGAFTRPWSIRKTYRRTDERVREYFCAVNNRNAPDADSRLTFQRRR